MLDSSKTSKDKDAYGFNAIELLMEMCVQHQIKLATGAMVSFPAGWKVLVLRFLNDIKHYPVVLFDVIDTYGQLDIRFEMKSEKHELQVWRLVDNIRVESRDTCMECGLLNYLITIPATHRRLCSDCYKVSIKESTGTWLDKYD